MNKWVVLGFLSAFSLSTVAKETLELVKVTKIREVALLGMNGSLENGVRNGSVTQKHYDCSKKTKPSYFNQFYIDMFESNLSKEQIKQALAFYSSDTGKKYTQWGILKFRTSAFNEQWQLPRFSKEELKTIGSFTNSAAGEILIKRRLTESVVVKSGLQQLLKKVYDKCKEQTSASKAK
ncbi:DUF2059 domain-containing protein [Pleionea sp. CnH1-48]|uniref:DUF2059 domain-containing protein n=1 Tax=Pleionea sp. CnH1-48 TaxID=2954494 RepID=UPI002097FA1F|nr:DUF2059 domain-containing protein [Pleionea sp. CnH1-48]MCO7223029.1 DUF2059 domain-containing protein [Pleionea sp. CnH1-48]